MRYSLSPMDYYFYRPNLYTIQFVFEYRGRVDSIKLKKSIESTAKIYPLIMCKLKYLSDFILEFDEYNEPFPLTIVELTEQPNLDSTLEVDNLIDSVTNLHNNPLFKVRVNYFKNQTYIGFSFSHMLGDGFSFMTLMQSISRIFNNLQVTEKSCNDRTLLYENNSERKITGSLERLFASTGYITPRPMQPLNSKLEKIIFKFEELKKLKEEVNIFTDQKISSNSFIMASLLKRYHLNIPLTESGELIVRCPVDYRRNYSKIPSNYFGNAVRDAITSFKADNFNKFDLIKIAEKIQQSINNVDEISIYKSLQNLDDLRQEHSISIFNELGCPGLLVSNLSRFPFDEIDFGLGSPYAIHHASQIPRLAIIMPHPEGFEVRFKVPL